MLFEFLERYKKIRVGGKIRIKGKYLPPNHILYGIIPVHHEFVDYIIENENIFTVRTIQKCGEDDVMISIYEMRHILEYDQIAVFSKRVLNWNKKR